MCNERKEMTVTDFVRELFGVIPDYEAELIYKMYSHHPDSKKNLIIDLLRSNPVKYVEVITGDDI